MTRVQIPVYTDRWMMGDQYGTLVNVTKRRKNFSPRAPVHADDKGTYVQIAHVKLDKSGKTIKVIYDDCREV
jgi:hypothetical protein